MINRALVDTGPLVALRDESDQHHAACLSAFDELRAPIFTCLPVLTEAAYLLRRFPGKVQDLLSLCGIGVLEVLPIERRDFAPIKSILSKYEDQGLQLADACLMHLAEREGIETIFTIDQRDFSQYQSPSGKRLRVIP